MRNSVRAKVIGTLPPRLHDSLKTIQIALRRGELPWRARTLLLMHAPRLLRRQARSHDLQLMLPGGPVYIGRDTSYIDTLVLHYIWNEHVFSTNCLNRVVIDLGAHKGYFGAWALQHDALSVISCEPQSDNFRMLERTRGDNTRASDWELMRIAVGASAGTVSLFVSPESWAHSIYEEMVDAVSVETVEMVPLATLLADAGKKWPQNPIVIKVNAEGAAGPILLATTAAQLEPVVEVLFDNEVGSPYDLEELLQHLAAAGLDEQSCLGDKLWRVQRPRGSLPVGPETNAH